jgi:hypothetical protein
MHRFGEKCGLPARGHACEVHGFRGGRYVLKSTLASDAFNTEDA